MIDNQYKVSDKQNQTADNLMKILSRCVKMYDAQQEIVRILTHLHNRYEKLTIIKKELKSYQDAKIKGIGDKYDLRTVRKTYQDLVRLSSRIMANIGTLKDIEKTMTRPFMFNGTRYDDNHMYLQMKRMRIKILRLIPRIADTIELKCFFTR